MVSALDEVVAFQFEVAALVDRKPAARREGRAYGTGSRRGEEFGGLEEDAGAGAGDPQRSEPEKSSERWGGRDLASQAERGKKGGKGFRTFRGLEFVGDGDRCVVILCAAAGVVPVRSQQDLGVEAPGGTKSGDGTSVCWSAPVERDGTAVNGVLELPPNPQVFPKRVSALFLGRGSVGKGLNTHLLAAFATRLMCTTAERRKVARNRKRESVTRDLNRSNRKINK